MAGNQQGDEFHINIANSRVETLVIGNGNIVNNCCRRLQYHERSKSCRSRSSPVTAIQDGGEWRGSKRKHQTKIRFPQRKFRPDPKRASSESEEDVTSCNSPEVLPKASADGGQTVVKSLNKFFFILNKLHPLRDGGCFEQFDTLTASLLLENKDDVELTMLLSIEMSVVVSYQSDLERAETMVLEALTNLGKAKVTALTNYYFLIAMAHCHLTGFYRRQNQHGKAEESIAKAEQNSKNTNSRFLKALIYYEMASNLTKYISTIPSSSAREEYVSRATHYMKQCISLCVELDDGHVYIRKHHFGLLKLALMNLNCRTSAARSKCVSPRSIEEAKNCLKTVEEKYENKMSKGQRIQFFMAKSDLNFRLNNLQDAEVDSRNALILAQANGFSLEVCGIKERLENISRLRSKETVTLEMPITQEGNAETLSSSTSPSMKNSPYSSGCDMEVA